MPRVALGRDDALKAVGWRRGPRGDPGGIVWGESLPEREWLAGAGGGNSGERRTSLRWERIVGSLLQEGWRHF